MRAASDVVMGKDIYIGAKQPQRHTNHCLTRWQRFTLGSFLWGGSSTSALQIGAGVTLNIVPMLVLC